jgi:hypothetical protein
MVAARRGAFVAARERLAPRPRAELGAEAQLGFSCANPAIASSTVQTAAVSWSP